MKLVYFWVEDFCHIKNQGFNLGSIKVFSHSYDTESKTLHLNWEENTSYIDGFFTNNGVGFSNVTALVGDNGSGKSLLLEQLICGLTQIEPPRIYRDCWDRHKLSIYEDNKKFYYKGITPSLEPPLSLVKLTGSSKANSRTIFYAPFYSFSETQRPESLVDVSSDSLLIRESDDDTKYLTPKFKGIQFHKSKEFLRQIFLVDDFRKELVDKKIYIPELVKIEILPSKDDSPDVDNFPIPFRTWFKRTWQMPLEDNREEWEIEQQREFGRREVESESDNDDDYLSREIRWLNEIEGDRSLRIKWISYLVFLRHFFLHLIRSVQSDPGGVMIDDYRKARIGRRERWNLKGCEVSETFIKKFPIKGLNRLLEPEKRSRSEAFLFLFLRNQDLFSPAIVPLVNQVKKLIFNQTNGYLDDVGIADGFHFYLTNEEAKNLILTHYQPFLKQPSYKAGVSFQGQFLQFGWEGMSTGEVGFLNLFSRLLAAKEILQQPNEDEEELPYPQTIYLLIDEGEHGFHLKWQRDYVKMLVEMIPKIFKVEQNPKVSIQLIFSTHSPISLSDIPDSHVVLVKKERIKEDGKAEFRCKVLDNAMFASPTFGANIHDLFKESFFMDEGFMGKFAEGKINAIISELNQSTEEKLVQKEEDLKKRIGLIGEPVLKQKLLEVLDFKLTQKMDDVKLIDQQIKDLEDRKRRIEEKRARDSKRKKG